MVAIAYIDLSSRLP